MDGLQKFAELLAVESDAGRIERILREIMTPAELENLELRWELLRLLAEGMPQREIAARLGISLCKITRGSRILKDSDSELSTIFKNAD